MHNKKGMKFFSFVKDGCCFTPVEIQVSLIPGLPEVKFTGLVDTAIKESAVRLKSAFRKSGFNWPARQQMVINLSPAYIKKSSPGMDLALASAILWKTGQMDFAHYGRPSLYFYGELDLKGRCFTPEDWKSLPLKEGQSLVIGGLEGKNYKSNIYSAENLRELFSGRLLKKEDWTERLKAPETPDIFFSQQASELLQITAVGEHALLLCGAAGSGKTTLAEHLYFLLAPPNKSELDQLERLLHSTPQWRPFISPHHTTSPLSVIGGGAPLFPGEISKAHGGVLFLDEYLEFHPKVQEALREPVEKGEIRIVRKGRSAVFPARFVLTATSNLCPCGDYEPHRPVRCAYSLRRCQSYLDRLSGPMMDRFDLLVFSKDWDGEKTLSLKSLKEGVEKARRFRLEDRGQKEPNARLTLGPLKAMLSQSADPLLPQGFSHRRQRALLRTARTFSDLKGESEISPHSVEKALKWTVKNFFFLKNRMISS